mgnify:CR=1 FL=1
MEKDRLEIFLYNALFTLYDTYTIDFGYDDENAFSKIKEETEKKKKERNPQLTDIRKTKYGYYL